MRAFCPKCYTTPDAAAPTCPDCERVAPQAGWPVDYLLGTRVDGDKYEVEAILGRGGFGTVYRVRHTLITEQTFAMKVLPSAASGSAAAEEAFLGEVRVLMKVQHPNIVACHDVGRLENGSLFLRMELAEGDTVDAALRAGRRFAPRRIAEIGAALAGALAAAHAKGVVHRDLKPDNVIIRPDGVPKLIDFGIAKLIEADEKVSRLIGSPLYMAPEQLRTGNPIDGRADVYQLGAVLHYMATGRSPYTELGTRDARAMLIEISRRQRARILDSGPRPSEMQPKFAELAPELDRYVGRMLSSDPRRRPAAVLAAEGLGQLSADASMATSSVLQPLNDELGDTLVADPSTGGDAPWVAVLPFDVRDPDTHASLAEELAEDIADTLSMSGQLRVRPHSVSAAQAASGLSSDALRSSLGVDIVIEGSLSGNADGYRVRVRAIHVGDGLQLWAGRFRGSISELFTLTDDIANAVAEALTDGAAPIARDRGELKPAVADLYLRARQELREHWAGDLSEAARLFDEALSLRPDHASILSCAAMCSARRAFNGGIGRGHMERARALCARALSSAPDRHEPLYARALILYVDNEWVGAMEDTQAALRIVGTHAGLQALKGRILAETGPLSKAIRHLQLATELDPNDTAAAVDCARALALAGRRGAAEKLLRSRMATTKRPGLIYFPLARLAAWYGEPISVPNFEPTNPADAFMLGAIELMRQAGETGSVPRELRIAMAQGALETDNRRRKLLFQQLSAEMSAFTGEFEDALIALSLADSTGLMDLMWLERCPMLAPLRSSEAYAEIEASVRARVAAVREFVR
jgi:eukaryotic-like serine/threonine-protein kinase